MKHNVMWRRDTLHTPTIEVGKLFLPFNFCGSNQHFPQPMSTVHQYLVLQLPQLASPVADQDVLIVTINTLYAPMRRYPVCFPCLLYNDATLPMLD